MTGRLQSTLRGPGLHKRRRRGSVSVFDIEAVEDAEAEEAQVSSDADAKTATDIGPVRTAAGHFKSGAQTALSGVRRLGHRSGTAKRSDVLGVTGGVLAPPLGSTPHPSTQPVPHLAAGADDGGDHPANEAPVPATPPALVVVGAADPSEEYLAPDLDLREEDRGSVEVIHRELPMDPRIRARRLSVVREASHRRTQLAVVALSVVTAAFFSIVAVHSALFGVRHLRIKGAVHTDLALIARVSGIDSSTPMVDVSGSAVAARLLRLPWVGTVRVAREWPATVRIQITERTPVAFAPGGPAAGGRWALIDQTGRVLDAVDAPPDGMLRLTGVASAGAPGTQVDAEADAALAVAATLPPDLVHRLVAVGPATNHRDDPDTALALPSRGVVLWGTPDDAAAKIIALATVLARVDLSHVATIDVRVPQAPTVRRS